MVCIRCSALPPGSRWSAMAGLALLCGLANPVQAQDSALAPSAMSKAPPVEHDKDIVIEGKTSAPPAALRKQAEAISNLTTKFHDPLARFQDKVCPGIVGMPADMAEIMVDRIRFNAERIGLKTARTDGCDPNILVVFVRNGQGVVKQLAHKQGYMFKALSGPELRELTDDAGPVHAWTNTLVRSRQGDVLQGDKDLDPTSIPVLNIAQSQSHIFLPHRIDIANTVILIDIPAVNGMSVVQLADYATMRAFAMTRPVSGDTAAGTILNLFDIGGDAVHPYELTDFDLAYLRTVYKGMDNLNAASKLAAINRNLRDVQKESLAEPAKQAPDQSLLTGGSPSRP